MKILNIKVIRIDGGTQSRVEIDNDFVSEYANAFDAGAEFPPVVVFHDGAEYWLADGFHRYHACRKAGKTSISADVRTGTARDAVLFSLGANGTHGLNRTNADKRKAITTMLNDAEWVNWSDSAIAKACHVTDKTVSACRLSIFGNSEDESCDRSQDRKRTVERKGKAYTQDTKNIGKAKAAAKEEPAKPVLAAVPAFPDEEYTEIDALQDQIGDLQSALVVANMGEVNPDDKTQAATLIAELRAEIKTLRASLKAVTTSRDSLMNELAQVKRQCVSLQSKMKKAE